MSDVTVHPSALVWPRPQFVPAPAHAPSACILARVNVPAPLPADSADWLPALVGEGRLHPDEAALADVMSPASRATFVAGRLAVRAALHSALRGALPSDHAHSPILRTARGAPVLPAGVAGSVSHKREAAIALVLPRRAAFAKSAVHVGVDLEHRPTARDLSRRSIAERILTTSELSALASLDHDPLAQRERVIVSFSIKEAVYKAIDPTVQRYVRFTEVALQFAEDGTVAVTLLLPELAHSGITVHAHVALDDRWIISTAIASP